MPEGVGLFIGKIPEGGDGSIHRLISAVKLLEVVIHRLLDEPGEPLLPALCGDLAEPGALLEPASNGPC